MPAPPESAHAAFTLTLCIPCGWCYCKHGSPCMPPGIHFAWLVNCKASLQMCRAGLVCQLLCFPASQSSLQTGPGHMLNSLGLWLGTSSVRGSLRYSLLTSHLMVPRSVRNHRAPDSPPPPLKNITRKNKYLGIITPQSNRTHSGG